MNFWMATGLPSLSSKKSNSGRRTITGTPFRSSYLIFPLVPITCSGGIAVNPFAK